MKRTWIMFGLVAITFATARCGGLLKQHPSQLKDAPPSVRTTVTVFDTQVYALEDGNGGYLDVGTITSLAHTALDEALATYSLTPTDVPEFYQMQLTLGDPSGCNLDWEVYTCTGPFSIHLTLKATGGPDGLGQASIDVPFTSLDPTNFKRLLAWGIQAVVDQMAQDGTLPGISGESPYY